MSEAQEKSSPITPGATDEFDFAAAPVKPPRLKRQTLAPKRPKKAAASGPPPAAEASARQEPAPRVTTAPVPPGESETVPVAAPVSGGAPEEVPAHPGPDPHETRPATLYYRGGSRPQKETPMPEPTPNTRAVAPATRPTSYVTGDAPVSRPSPTTSRPAGPTDYRSNIERQAKEQKAFGGLLALLVYSLLGLFLLGGGLAGYGLWTVSRQLHQQSLTLAEVDARYRAETQDLNRQLQAADVRLAQAQLELTRLQETMVHQQDLLARVQASSEARAAALRQETTQRTQEAAALRQRLRTLESRAIGPIFR